MWMAGGLKSFLNKFPSLTSLHAQVPGNRCQLSNGGEKKKYCLISCRAMRYSLLHKLQSSWLHLWRRENTWCISSGDAQCKCRVPPHLPPPPTPHFPLQTRCLRTLYLSTVWATHSLFLPPPVDWRARSRTHIHLWAHNSDAQTQGKLKKHGDNN